MIKISGVRNGRPMMVFGISEKNVEMLKKGHPIHVHGDELGYEGEIVICYGVTEDALARELLPLLKRDTVVIDQRDKKRN